MYLRNARSFTNVSICISYICLQIFKHVHKCLFIYQRSIYCTFLILLSLCLNIIRNSLFLMLNQQKIYLKLLLNYNIPCSEMREISSVSVRNRPNYIISNFALLHEHYYIYGQGVFHFLQQFERLINKTTTVVPSSYRQPV